MFFLCQLNKYLLSSIAYRGTKPRLPSQGETKRFLPTVLSAIVCMLILSIVHAEEKVFASWDKPPYKCYLLGPETKVLLDKVGGMGMETAYYVAVRTFDNDKKPNDRNEGKMWMNNYSITWPPHNLGGYVSEKEFKDVLLYNSERIALGYLEVWFSSRGSDKTVMCYSASASVIPIIQFKYENGQVSGFTLGNQFNQEVINDLTAQW